jgi:phosphoglucosamine mutase
VLSAAPDGRNINLDCGSTHPEALARAVREHGCRMGVAFDGDGDRAIFVDASGKIVDGDAVLLMCGRHWKAQGRLQGNAIAATVMSNIGLELALRESGIELIRCAVGDKYVMEEMINRGLSIGGEQSGHIIFSNHLFTGDGIVTALSVLRVMADTGRELADLASELVTFPQVLVNVRVREKKDLASVPAIAATMARVERQLDGAGRLLVRFSGTEPLLRVMIEGKNQQEIQGWAADIAATVKEHLG